MTNIGSIPFAAGQSFLVCSNNFGLPNLPESQNRDYTFDPIVPGFGLAWDAFDTNTVGGAMFMSNGIVNIKALTTTPTNITVTITSNLWAFSWPSNYVGWRLEGQTNKINVGISNNWVNIPGANLTNRIFIRTAPTNDAVFFRMAHP
jgi:hypothetical protein